MNEHSYISELIRLAHKSSCLRRNTSALVVTEFGQILGRGYNGAPRGVENCKSTGICLRSSYNRGDGLESCVAVHSEVAAIIDATSHMPYLKESGSSIIYCTDQPCINCLKTIVQSCIKVVRYIRPYPIMYSHAYELIAEQVDMKQLDLTKYLDLPQFEMDIK